MGISESIRNVLGFRKKDNMTQSKEFEPTDIFKDRYSDPEVLIRYVKTLGFTNENIIVKKLRDGRLGLKLPRKLSKEELEGALNAFKEAEEERQGNDEE